MQKQCVKPFSAAGLPGLPTQVALRPHRRCRGQPRAAGRVTAAASQAGAGGPSAAKKQAWAPPSGILKINPELLKAGGLDPLREGPQARASFSGHLTGLFTPVNLEHPGVRILNIDPPVLVIDSFLTHQECDDIVAAAADSGLMRQSGVGVGGYSVKDEDNVRTSSTLAATQEVLASQPALSAALGVMLARARALLGAGPLPPDGAAQFARPSSPGAMAFELPQVARYQPGQHFLTHEDAFPLEVAASKGYQRRATLLTYLNDCEQGGATRFDVLDIAVQPRKGSALLFFPSFANGVPDRRTLHTATDAVSEKWVTQLWLSCGLPQRRPAGQQAAGAGAGAALPAYVRGVKGAPGGGEARGPKGKRGVPPQRVNTKI